MEDKITDLPRRIQGEDGNRADNYLLIDKRDKIVILNDKEFESIVSHNSKRSYGENDNAIWIENEEDEMSYLIIRKSSIAETESNK